MYPLMGLSKGNSVFTLGMTLGTLFFTVKEPPVTISWFATPQDKHDYCDKFIPTLRRSMLQSSAEEVLLFPENVSRLQLTFTPVIANRLVVKVVQSNVCAEFMFDYSELNALMFLMERLFNIL